MNMQIDASGSNGGGDRDLCVAKVTPAAPAHNHIEAGLTPETAAGPRSGVGCMAAGGCHGVGGTGGQFYVAGTAYTAIGGGTPAVGATVRLFNPGTKVSIAKTTTDEAGNFYISTPITFTATGLETDITGCGSNPDIIPMIAPIRANEGNCSSSDACHIVPGPRAIFLP